MKQPFDFFRKNSIGYNAEITTPYGKMPMIYADWIASGRLYRPIEDIMSEKIGPFVANTHTETSTSGVLMTEAYHEAKHLIKKHVNAGKNDVFLNVGYGMTGAVNKLQRILGLKYCGMLKGKACLSKNEKPIVFVSHLEHHSNQTSWYETIADVVIIPPGKDLLFDLNNLESELIKHKDREIKIGSFSAASNVTGYMPPIHAIAALMHRYNGICFADYAASAPYVSIDMHPQNPLEALDGIFFSPHKFLGGPGSGGVLIFSDRLYHNITPDQPGGGTVEWTNPWGEHRYIDDIEIREDGGTPGFLQTMRTALSIKLKEEMGVANIMQREHDILGKVFNKFKTIPGLHILADNVKERIGAVSFYIENIHYNLVVQLLNDRFGIQVRGGCACAGTYGHYLLDVSYETSKQITDQINHGDLSHKPGWIRLSIHPTMTDQEIDIIGEAVHQVSIHHKKWMEDYEYNRQLNAFFHRTHNRPMSDLPKSWFSF